MGSFLFLPKMVGNRNPLLSDFKELGWKGLYFKLFSEAFCVTSFNTFANYGGLS